MTAVITAITQNVQLKLTNIHESIIIHNTAVKFILIKIENSFLDIVPILINSCLPLLHKIYTLRKNILAVQQAVHAPLLVLIEN